MHSQRLEVIEDGRPWQFSLPALCGVTLSVGVLCSLARFGASYVVAALTLGFATLLIRLYVQSGYQQRLRVQGTLLGGLLFLSSLIQ